jgi:ribosome-binding protein aMBF1 (putative translation factor)
LEVRREDSPIPDIHQGQRGQHAEQTNHHDQTQQTDRHEERLRAHRTPINYLQVISQRHPQDDNAVEPRRRRGALSQLGLALESGVSQRHVSFLESGRAKPSRQMILQLSETLEVPLRERND